MSPTSLISLRRSQAKRDLHSKKRLLDYLAELYAPDLSPTLSADDVFDGLCERERLGSTGLGQGIAIPHCRLVGLQTPLMCWISLSAPIDYDAVDGQPVDLIASLIVPESDHEQHLQLLSKIAQFFSNTSNVATLRQLTTDLDLVNQVRFITQP